MQDVWTGKNCLAVILDTVVIFIQNARATLSLNYEMEMTRWDGPMGWLTMDQEGNYGQEGYVS